MIYHLTISIEDDEDFPLQHSSVKKLLAELENKTQELGFNIYDTNFEMD